MEHVYLSGKTWFYDVSMMFYDVLRYVLCMKWDDVRWCEILWDYFSPFFHRGLRERRKQGAKSTAFRKAEEGRLLHLGEDGEPLDCPYPLKEGEKKYIYPQGGEVTIEVPWKITPLISWLFCYCDAVLAACLHWKDAPLTMPIHVFVLQTHDVSLVSMVTISFRAPISSISSHDIPNSASDT